MFIYLHKLFDELAEGLLGYVDLITERVTALAGAAMGTLRMATNDLFIEIVRDLVKWLWFLEAHLQG